MDNAVLRGLVWLASKRFLVVPGCLDGSLSSSRLEDHCLTGLLPRERVKDDSNESNVKGGTRYMLPSPPSTAVIGYLTCNYTCKL